LNFDNTRPIYIQIMDEIKKQIIRRELKPGDKILSQREFAQEAKVNPNTVQRAYKEMENLNIVETIRGQGTFICNRPGILEEIKSEMAGEILDNFFKEIRSLGFNNEEITQLINNWIEKV